MPRRKKNSHENHSRSSLSINKEKPQQRYAANARERARMRVLSRAFCRLKTTLPWVPADTKLSKLDTLRLAASYIAHLKGILRDETLGPTESSLHPAMSMTWPFGFNRPLGGSTGGGSHEGGSLVGSEDDIGDMDDVDDGDNEDGESVSSCTWEEVSPPSSTKDCVHLGSSPAKRSGGGAKARDKGSCSNLVQVRGKESSSSPSTLYLNKQSVAASLINPTNNNQDHYADKNTHSHSTIIRPMSQMYHHHQHHNHFTNDPAVLFSHTDVHLENKLSMVVTNPENVPSITQNCLLGTSQQNETVLGMENSAALVHDPFGGELNEGHGHFQQQDIHHHHNLNGNSGEMHTIGGFAFTNSDIMSIG